MKSTYQPNVTRRKNYVGKFDEAVGNSGLGVSAQCDWPGGSGAGLCRH